MGLDGAFVVLVPWFKGCPMAQEMPQRPQTSRCYRAVERRRRCKAHEAQGVYTEEATKPQRQTTKQHQSTILAGSNHREKKMRLESAFHPVVKRIPKPLGVASARQGDCQVFQLTGPDPSIGQSPAASSYRRALNLW